MDAQKWLTLTPTEQDILDRACTLMDVTEAEWKVLEELGFAEDLRVHNNGMFGGYWYITDDGFNCWDAGMKAEEAKKPAAVVVPAERPENDNHETAILRLYNELKSPLTSESIYDWMLRADAALTKEGAI